MVVYDQTQTNNPVYNNNLHTTTAQVLKRIGRKKVSLMRSYLILKNK